MTAARLATKHAGPIRPIMTALRAFVISGTPPPPLDDARLHELLALFDALRIGQARERELAKKLLEQRLQ